MVGVMPEPALVGKDSVVMSTSQPQEVESISPRKWGFTKADGGGGGGRVLSTELLEEPGHTLLVCPWFLGTMPEGLKSGPQTSPSWGRVVKVVARGVPSRWLRGRTVTPASQCAPSGWALGSLSGVGFIATCFDSKSCVLSSLKGTYACRGEIGAPGWTGVF